MNSTEELGVRSGQQIEGGAPIHPREERPYNGESVLTDPQEGPFKPAPGKHSEADQLPFKVAGRWEPPKEREQTDVPGRVYEGTAPIEGGRIKGSEKGDFKPADKPAPHREDSDEDFTPAHVNPSAKKEEPKAKPKEDTKEG